MMRHNIENPFGIRWNNGNLKSLGSLLDAAVFPGMQGGPLMHAVAAKAIALKEASTPAYQSYAKSVIANAQALSSSLAEHGMRSVSGGTDTHLALIDLQALGVNGADAEKRCDAAGITLNKNSIPFDPEAPSVTSGIRVGTPAATTQGMGIPEMAKIAEFISRAVRGKGDPAEIRAQVTELTHAFPAYPR